MPDRSSDYAQREPAIFDPLVKQGSKNEVSSQSTLVEVSTCVCIDVFWHIVVEQHVLMFGFFTRYLFFIWVIYDHCITRILVTLYYAPFFLLYDYCHCNIRMI